MAHREIARDGDEERAAVVAPSPRREIASSFALLGWTAFGGPAAHVALFNETFVKRSPRPWMTSGTFAELLALGQCLPGPTSTQMSFAIGIARGGAAGGALSGTLFQYPGLLLMSLAGAGAAETLVNPGQTLRALAAGLSAAGAGLIASAAASLTRSRAKTATTKVLCATSAVVACYHQTAWLFPALIAFGGCATTCEARARERWAKKEDGETRGAREDASGDEDAEEVAHLGLTPAVGGCLIVGWIVALVALGIAVSKTDYASNKELHWFEAFWRTGSIIFGGGQVVLPLLLNDVVQYDTTCSIASGATSCVRSESLTSWVTEEQFFAGLAMAQAMPGPLFNLSAYLGAVAARRAGVNVVVGIMCAWFGLFGPGVILIFAVLPFWGKFRKWRVYRRALPGLNASAVGLVVAAAFNIAFKVKSLSPFPNATVCIGMICTFCVHVVKLPRGTWTLIQAPLVVVLGGLLGLIAHGTGMN